MRHTRPIIIILITLIPLLILPMIIAMPTIPPDLNNKDGADSAGTTVSGMAACSDTNTVTVGDSTTDTLTGTVTGTSGNTYQGVLISLKDNPVADYMARVLLDGDQEDMKGLTFTTQQVAALFGNWTRESSMTFNAIEGRLDGKDHRSNEAARETTMQAVHNSYGTGLGLAQWTNTRGIQLIDLADSMHAHWYDRRVAARMVINELAGDYRVNVMERTKNMTDVMETATVTQTWYEGGGITEGEPGYSIRRNAARLWYEQLKTRHNKRERKPGDHTPASSGQAANTDTGSQSNPNTDGDSDSETTSVDCSQPSDTTNGVAYGEAGGAPTNKHDYGWMCKWGGICKDGDGLRGEDPDPKNFYTYNFRRYQCTWYAWNRLAMIHGEKGWTFVGGHGGQVAANAAKIKGWTVDDQPHPGDGVSQLGGALGGDTSTGHIAVVETVQRKKDKGWRILISEGNFNTGGDGRWTGYNTRWLDDTQFRGAGRVFFRWDKWTDASQSA